MQKHILSFFTYHEQIASLKQQRLIQKEQINKQQQCLSYYEHKQFTHEERENLKNAFRYISRLAFKESQKYINKFRQITFSRNHFLNQSQFREKLATILRDAEMISGERYFKEYLSNLNLVDQQIILEYMIWFLQHKYLRYLKNAQTERGKRKNMKKQLYLRFKNEVMLPYLSQKLQTVQQ